MEVFKVNIGGVPYKVFHKEDAFKSDALHFGEIKYKESEIILSTGMNEELEKETLIHEIIHGVLWHIGRDDLYDNEQFVQAFAQGLMGSVEVKKV